MSSLSELWKQQYEDNKTKIGSYFESVEGLQETGGLIERNKNTPRYSDVWRRWGNKDSNQRRKEHMGSFEDLGKIAPYEKEPRDIDVDVTVGEAKYHRGLQTNKWIQEPKSGLSNKTNYVYAYRNFSKSQIGEADIFDTFAAASLGFNLGQQLGGSTWRDTVKDGIYSGLYGEFITELSNAQNIDIRETKDLDEEISKIQESLYKALLPGVARLPINFRSRISLNRLLKQNQLPPRGGRFDANRKLNLPGDIEKTIVGFNTGSADIRETWRRIYKKDKNSQNPDLRFGADETFPRGYISNTDVRELEEPRHNNKGEPIEDTGVISFDNDERYNTYDSRKRGFYSNILGNVRTGDGTAAAGTSTPQDGGALLPAVEQIDNPTVSRSEASSFGQYFPFMFETTNRSIDPITGATKAETYEQYAYFQATLQQLSEQYAPNWTSTHFSGRTEDVHTYQKGGRTVDIRFVIFANSARELQNVYERTNWLAQQTYPLFDSNPDKISGGPIIKITIGDLLKQVPGFIRSLSFNWDFLGVNKWEIEPGLRMPMACEVSMNFQVIHDAMPDRDTDFYSGLRNKMLVGGGNEDLAIGPDIVNDRFTLNKAAWSNNSNLIPTTESDPSDASTETFVTLLARKNIKNPGIEPLQFTLANGEQSRTYSPGQSLSYADLQGALVGQVGEADRPPGRAG